jgi:hypothetical protein
MAFFNNQSSQLPNWRIKCHQNQQLPKLHHLLSNWSKGKSMHGALAGYLASSLSVMDLTSRLLSHQKFLLQKDLRPFTCVAAKEQENLPSVMGHIIFGASLISGVIVGFSST